MLVNSVKSVSFLGTIKTKEERKEERQIAQQNSFVEKEVKDLQKALQNAQERHNRLNKHIDLITNQSYDAVNSKYMVNSVRQLAILREEVNRTEQEIEDYRERLSNLIEASEAC